MKKIIYCTILFSFLVCSVFAQADATDTLKPYQKQPTLPAFNILMLDSTTIFNTFNIADGNPTALVMFDPNCKHCKHSIGDLMKVMDSVKDVQFYFVSLIHDMTAIRNFYTDYHMGDHQNIKMVGRDYELFFLEHYKVRSLPDVALYDGHKKFVKLIEGDFTATTIYNALREKKK